LSPQDIKNLWRFYHTRDNYTGLDSNSNAGFGKINAFDAIKFLEQFLIVPSPESKNHSILVCDQTNRRLHVVSDFDQSHELTIYDLNGKQLLNGIINTGEYVSTERISAGIYWYCIENDDGKKSGKILIPTN